MGVDGGKGVEPRLIGNETAEGVPVEIEAAKPQLEVALASEPSLGAQSGQHGAPQGLVGINAAAEGSLQRSKSLDRPPAFSIAGARGQAGLVEDKFIYSVNVGRRELERGQQCRSPSGARLQTEFGDVRCRIRLQKGAHRSEHLQRVRPLQIDATIRQPGLQRAQIRPVLMFGAGSGQEPRVAAVGEGQCLRDRRQCIT